MRKDLHPSQICVQVAHACVESTKHAPYSDEHPHLIVVALDSETKLNNAIARLEANGIPCYSFYEPDIGNQLTAAATGIVRGADRLQFKRFQLLNL